MNVLIGLEGSHQRWLVGDVCEDAQLNLRVVGGEQIAALIGEEGMPNAPANLGTYRDILQVRVR